MLWNSFGDFLRFLVRFPALLFSDLLLLWCLIKVKWYFFWYTRTNNVVVKQFDALAPQYAHKTAIIHHGHRFRFLDIQRLSLKISSWIENQTETINLLLCTGPETPPEELPQIGLMFGNTPEMACFILGVLRTRCGAVLFNHNHKSDTLKNAFAVSNVKVFIFEQSFLPVIQEIAADLPDIRFYVFDRYYEDINEIYKSTLSCQTLIGRDENGNEIVDVHKYRGLSRDDLVANTNIVNFAPILAQYSDEVSPRNYPYSINDNILYLFTSGTTGGKVKLVPLNNIRFLISWLAQTTIFHYKSSDNIYVCLPLYHGTASAMGLGTCFLSGATVTLANKFSASNFLNDCRKYGCTVSLYIGELIRYLLAQPPSELDTQHSLRMLNGVGMKKELWLECQQRFGIKDIAELYSSSEANFGLFNNRHVPGSVGILPYYYSYLYRRLFPVYLIKVNEITMEPIRDESTGLCKLAKPGDLGTLVGLVRQDLSYSRFQGYTSKEDTKKKIINNIISKGDCAFASGDLFTMDVCGNLFFKDRTGDTFRWKGENVSTTEVESVAAKFLDKRDCSVYGVLIPKTDGRAGMISIKYDADNDKPLDLNAFYLGMKEHLPEYALPKFVRLTATIPTTSTHKLIKHQQKQIGFNPKLVDPGDKLFYYDRKSASFQVLDQKAFDNIQEGKVQF